MGCLGIPGSRARDSSDNFRQEKTAESDRHRRQQRAFPDPPLSKGRRPLPLPQAPRSRIVMRGIARFAAISPLLAASLNALTSSLPHPLLDEARRPRLYSARCIADATRCNMARRRGRKMRRATINWIPDWQFPVCRTPPRFPQQPLSPIEHAPPGRPSGHSIKPTRGDSVAIQTQHLVE